MLAKALSAHAGVGLMAVDIAELVRGGLRMCVYIYREREREGCACICI